jgi:hypothetical protein
MAARADLNGRTDLGRRQVQARLPGLTVGKRGRKRNFIHREDDALGEAQEQSET